VHIPGLPSHPQHDIGRKQASRPGAILCFRSWVLDAARPLLKITFKCGSLAESLGGVEHDLG